MLPINNNTTSTKQYSRSVNASEEDQQPSADITPPTAIVSDHGQTSGDLNEEDEIEV